MPRLRKKRATGSGSSFAVFYARGYELAKPRPGVHSYVDVPVPRRFACSYYFSLFGRSPGNIVCPQFWELKWAVAVLIAVATVFCRALSTVTRALGLRISLGLGESSRSF